MDTQSSKTSRRNFIKKTSGATVGSALAFNISSSQARKRNSNTLKVGLIGCGGRGTGAANQALNADPDVILGAMADIFPDKMEKSHNALLTEHPERAKLDGSQKFLGFDAFQRVLDSDVDMVILTTPPSFRPAHLEAAIKAGKHVFCEKPVAVDAPGIRRILKVAKQAKEKNLSLMSGFCWRYDFPKRAIFERVLDGEIGDIVSIYNTYNTGALWSNPKKEGWNDMEYKMRNWLYYNWLSGDHIIEQAIHSIDMMSWALRDVPPVSATGTGGRQSRTDELFGNVYDHFAIEFTYANGAKGFHFSRQQKDCSRSYAVEIMGTEGVAKIDCIKRKHTIQRPYRVWEYSGETNNMYQTEHDELFAAIRKGKPVNDGDWMAQSTMIGILARMVAYTGQTITYEDALKSDEILGPKIDEYNWELDWPTADVAKPGITKFS
ncbi:MAG: Gfo/Idh/MocA family oxidoreductase [Bacteroidota bacterium]